MTDRFKSHILQPQEDDPAIFLGAVCLEFPHNRYF